MKYIKTYEDIDWDDWDIDEEDPNIPKIKFVKFLKDNDAYDKFINNFDFEVGDWIDSGGKETFFRNVTIDKSMSSLEKYFKNNDDDPEVCLVFAFTWGDTPEGYDYWQNLNIKWIKNNINESIDWDDWDVQEEDHPNDSPLTDKLFVQFLKDNDAYDKYVYNLEKYPYLNRMDDHQHYMAYIKLINWQITKDGYNYWLNLQIKWINFFLKSHQ